jgi:transcriptional regulator with XRE-family HTH domain
VAESLADYVRRVMSEKGLTYREVQARSRNGITTGGVSDIVQGKTKNPGIHTLSALARGLGVPEEEIISVARGKDPEGDPDFKNWKFASLFDDAQQLTPEQMKDFEVLMEIARREVQRMIQEQEKELPRKPRRPPPAPKAADVPEEKVKRRA